MVIKEIELTKSSLDEILGLHEDSIFPIWDSFGREYTSEEVQEVIMKVFSNGEVFGYFDGEKLVGAIGLRLHKQEDSLEICFLLINSSFEGRGLGRELITFVEKEFIERVHRIFLEVLIQNPAANFYKMLDYDVVGKRGQKYVMEKRI